MVKRPLVIPTVRIVHVCPPIVVHTNLSDFPAVVQELTGRVKNTSRSSSSSINHEHFDKFMVSDASLSSSFMQKSNEEDGSCTLANDSMSAYTHDHQSNHTKNGSVYDAWIKACSIECNNDCCAYKNGTHMFDELQIWPYEEYWLDGPIDEEVCIINEAESVVSRCNFDLSRTTTTSYTGNCKSINKREEDNIECTANAQLSELVIDYPDSTTARSKSERRPVKKTKLIHAASPDESHLDHQHLMISNIILNSMDFFPPSVK